MAVSMHGGEAPRGSLSVREVRPQGWLLRGGAPRAARTRPRNATGAATFDFSNVSKAVARAIERDERANEGKAAEQQALSSANGTPRRAGAMPFETQRMGRSHQKTRHSFRESHAPAGQEQEYRDSHLQHTRTVDWIKSGAF